MILNPIHGLMWREDTHESVEWMTIAQRFFNFSKAFHWYGANWIELFGPGKTDIQRTSPKMMRHFCMRHAKQAGDTSVMN
jgi:hypothetical protein